MWPCARRWRDAIAKATRSQRRWRISKRRLSFASKICAPEVRRSPTRPPFAEHMNSEVEARTRAARLAEASRKVRKESMRVNAEFAAIEREPDEQETDPLQVGTPTQRVRRTRIRRPAK